MNVGVPRSLAGNCLPNRGRLFRSPTDSELVFVNTWYNFHSASKNGKRKGETTESANEEIFYIMKQREHFFFYPNSALPTERTLESGREVELFVPAITFQTKAVVAWLRNQ